MSSPSEVTEEHKEELLAFVGENAGYYEMAWFSSDRPKFNWVAALFPLPWLVYRKMYGVAGVFFANLVIVGGVLSIFLSEIVISVLAGAICGFLGNRWYFKHVHRKVALVQSKESTKEKRLEILARRGDVNLGGAIAVAFIGLVLVILSGFYASTAY